MYPSKDQLALLKQCHDLWGKKNVKFTGPTERDLNLHVVCKGRNSINHMTYAPDGTILASRVDMAMELWDEPVHKSRNAIDN